MKGWPGGGRASGGAVRPRRVGGSGGRRGARWRQVRDAASSL